jgi:gliding motility-associated-like protein
MLGDTTSCNKAFLLLSIFLLLAGLSHAQINLVPNPGFEELYSDPPCNLTTPLNELFDQKMKHWYAPSGGTPDVKSLLVTEDCYGYCFSTHELAQGPQAPRSGNAYALIITWGSGCNTEENYREYMQVKLKQALEAGKTYYAEMYVSKADTCKGPSNNLGMYFSPDPVSGEDCGYLNFSPQILETSVIMEEEEWVKVSGEFTADTTMDYLTIGNFFPNEETIFVNLQPDKPHAVYYIDDIKVEEVLCPKAYSELRATLCEGDSLWAGGKVYTETGLFIDTLFAASLKGCDSILTIELEVVPTKRDTLELSLCPGKELTINGQLFNEDQPQGLLNYASSEGCDSLLRWVKLRFDGMAIDLQKEDPSCPGEEDGLIELENVSGGLPPYFVQIQETSYFTQLSHPIPFSGLPAGVYPLQITDSLDCVFSGEISLEAPVPLELSIPSYAEIKLGEEFRPRPQVNFFPELIHWESTSGKVDCSECLDARLLPYHDGYFHLRLEDEKGCQISDSILLHVLPADFGYVPNAFSPDGDGYNDHFSFFPGPSVRQIHHFAVYSRWGELLFERRSLSASLNSGFDGWDGRFHNQPMPPETYLYFIDLERIDGKREIIKGSVMLVR